MGYCGPCESAVTVGDGFSLPPPDSRLKPPVAPRRGSPVDACLGGKKEKKKKEKYASGSPACLDRPSRRSFGEGCVLLPAFDGRMPMASLCLRVEQFAPLCYRQCFDIRSYEPKSLIESSAIIVIMLCVCLYSRKYSQPHGCLVSQL